MGEKGKEGLQHGRPLGPNYRRTVGTGMVTDHLRVRESLV